MSSGRLFFPALALATLAATSGACALGTSTPATSGDKASDGSAAAGGGRGGAGATGGTPAGTGSTPPGGGTTGAGMGAGAAPAGTPAGGTPAPAASFAPTDFARGYAYRGRFDLTDPQGPRYAWPNSAIGATFTGTSLALKLSEPVPTLYNNTPVNNMYDVFVDARPVQRIATTPGSNVYPVVTGLPEGSHTMWMTKRTEANIGRGQFGGVVLSAGATLQTPPALRPRQMEFIGDSSSSGYGLDGNYPKWDGCRFSVDTADSTLSYPAVTSELLGAEFQNLAFAGKGITRNLADAVDKLTMPIIYPLWDPRDTQARYTFPGPPAEVTVINIGGNDWKGDGPVGDPPDQDTFVKGYIGLIQAVRSHSPNTFIFCAVTPMAHGQDRVTYIAYVKAVVDAATAQGIANVRTFEFQEYNGELGFGCDGHPNAAAAKQMATMLAAAIRAAKGWP